MSTDKRWTYKQITDNAVEQMNVALERAKQNPGREDVFYNQARGVYEMWFSLTSGHIEDGDIDRLYDLMDAKLWFPILAEAANRS